MGMQQFIVFARVRVLTVYTVSEIWKFQCHVTVNAFYQI